MSKARPKDCDPATWRLYKAIENYAKQHHGSVLVVGGVQVLRRPGDNPCCYHISVQCTGREPGEIK